MTSAGANRGLGPTWLRGRRGRSAIVLVAVALLVVGVFALVGKVAGFTDTLRVLREIDAVWLVVCLASQVVFYFAYAVVFRSLARVGDGVEIAPTVTARVIFAALGATRLLATGGAGGLALLYWVLTRAGLSRRDSVTRVLGMNTLLYAWFGALSWLAAVLLLVGLGDEAPLAMTLPWIITIAIFFLLAVWMSDPSRVGRLTEPGATGRARSGLAVAVAGVAIVRDLAGRPRENRVPLVGALCYWLADILCLWVALRAFGIEIGPATIVLAYATGFLANLLPLPTGGIGGVDAATTFALHALGVPLAPALLGVFVYRFFSFLLPTVLALLALPTLPAAVHELGAQGEARP